MVEKFQRDITDLFNYPSDENPTTQADYISAVKNWQETERNLVDSVLWQPDTDYAIGAVVKTPSIPSQYILVCTQEGTSGTEEPDYTDVSTGYSISDGTAIWRVETIVSLDKVNDMFTNIIELIESGEALTGDMWSLDIEENMFANKDNIVPKTNGVSKLGTAEKRWGEIHVVTPTKGDNSEKAATTAYVQAELEDYLALTGGTIIGNLSVSGTITGNLAGNANTATNAINATNDGNGNPISTTYLPRAGGTITGELNAPRLNVPFDFSKGTTPSETRYAAVCFSDKDGSDYETNCIGLIESSVTTANLSKTYMRALRNAAGSGANCEISVNVDNSGNGYTAAPTPAQTDDSTKIATTAYVKDCVPKSVGGTQRPVYTNSNGVITACTQTGDYGGLEGVSGKGGAYIRWASGYQICQGASSAKTTGTTVTFPAAFSSAPRVIVCAGGYTINPGFGDVTATGVRLTSDSSSGATVYYIAIGYWK